MKLPWPLYAGRLVKRYKRFLADVKIDKQALTGPIAKHFFGSGQTNNDQHSAEMVLTAHCPNPGSMMGLLELNSELILSYSPIQTRKLLLTVECVKTPTSLVLVNTMRPNQIVHEALKGGVIEEIGLIKKLKREVKISDHSRIDFVATLSENLADSGKAPKVERAVAIEVKGVTLAVGGIGYFPDAVTTRGTKHLDELTGIAKAGQLAVMLFLVCRTDVTLVRAARAIDPAYARAIRRAKRAGVQILAYRVKFQASEEQSLEILVDRRLPFQVFSKDPGPSR